MPAYAYMLSIIVICASPHPFRFALGRDQSAKEVYGMDRGYIMQPLSGRVLCERIRFELSNVMHRVNPLLRQ